MENSSITKEVAAQEGRLTIATRELDLETLDRIYADDILFTGVTGATCGKASLMDEAKRGKAHGETGVTSWRFAITVHNKGHETKRAYRTTNVWMRRGAVWQVVAGHTSTLEAVPV